MRKFKRGEKFFYQGRPRVCLDVRGRQMLAFQLGSLASERMRMDSQKVGTGKCYARLIEEIDRFAASVAPGSVIRTEFGEVTIKEFTPSGDARGVNEKGKECLVDRWCLLVAVARYILSEGGRELVHV